jgi:hypothetical protein
MGHRRRNPSRRRNLPVSDAQGWILIVEVGVIALGALLGILRRT